MIKHSCFFLLKLAHALLLLQWVVGSASAECGDFTPLSDLTAEMRMVATGQAPLEIATARRVARHVQNVDFDEVRQRLQRIDMSDQFRDIERMGTIATEYSQTLRAIDQVSLMRIVRDVEELLKLFCRPQLEVKPQLEYGTVKGKFGASLKGILNSILENDSTVLKLILLLLFLSGLIGLLFFLKYTLGYMIGFLNHKKICRVPAKICGNEQTFPGIVTRAGLNGVRFEFDSDAVAKRLSKLMASPEFVYFDLFIDDDNWPVFVDGYHKFFSPLYFLERLTRKDLGNILARSTRATLNAPSIGHKSTRKKWRALIKQRKSDIRNTSRRRSGSG